MKWRMEKPRGCTYDIEVKVRACTPDRLGDIMFLKEVEEKNHELIVVDIMDKDGSIEKSILMKKKEEAEKPKSQMKIHRTQTVRSALNELINDDN